MTTLSPASRLYTKLTDLDLDDDEAALLGAVLRLAQESSGSDVEGFRLGLNTDGLGSAGLFPSRNQRAEFKGSDEELQIIDWLGSLEYK